MKKRPSHVVHAGLASAVLYFALELSAGDRGPIDYAVFTLLGGALVYNLVQLGRRLHAVGGGKAVWHLGRTLGFWIVGLFNTLLVRPEDVGSLKNWIGWALVSIALLDSIALYRKERAAVPAHPA